MIVNRLSSLQGDFDPEAYPWATVTTKNGGALVYPQKYRYISMLMVIDEIERDRRLMH
ncbi:MAG: hypothetical protein ACLU4N_21935 [Butyricimonas faecihominis]